VAAPSLAVFKARLDGAGLVEGVPAHGRGVGPFQPKPFYDFVILWSKP